jgi:alpha-tubulin suppressor-like RCC1 family protein
MNARRDSVQVWLLIAAMMQALLSGAQPVTKIGAESTSYHSLFLKGDGSLWAMGMNNDGQLGDGTTTKTNLPEPIVSSNVTAVAAGYRHSLFLKSDGSLWGMGQNGSGQLGIGTLFSITLPAQIVASNVTAIAAGYSHSLFLKSDGSLWAMGDNANGDLGDGRIAGTNQPEPIVASNVTAIAAGYTHNLFLKSDGSLWAMGNNQYGQLGDGHYGTLPTFGTNQPEQIVASNVTAIAAGMFHSLFLMNDGSLWAMGRNSSGQLGDGTYGAPPLNATNQPEQIVSSNVMAIAAGYEHSLFLKNDGSLWAMGDNSAGQLGLGMMSKTNRPALIVTSGVTAIAAGYWHSLFLKNDGSLWTMGDNVDGALGDGTNSNTNRPEQILAAYNQIFGQDLGGGKMQMSFVGIAGANYALDRSSGLSPARWVPQTTNPANSFGVLVFTNTFDLTTNNFWRIRSVP